MIQPGLTLYTMKHATNARRVRIFLAEKGIEVDQIDVDILKGEHLTPAYLAINPRGLLPALQLADGTVIDESIAICRYIEEMWPEPPLMGTTPLEKAQVESWQRHIEFDGMMAIASVFRNSAPQFANRPTPGSGPQSPQIPALAERGRAQIIHFFDQLEARLATSPFIAGPRYSVADITGLCTIDFAKWVDARVPQSHSATLAWYAALRARPSYGA